MLPSELFKKVLSVYSESIKTVKTLPYDDNLFYDKLPFIQGRSSHKTSLLNTYLLSIYPELVNYFDFSFRTREIIKKEYKNLPIHFKFQEVEKIKVEFEYDDIFYDWYTNKDSTFNATAVKYIHFSKDELINEILKEDDEICKQIRKIKKIEQENELDYAFKLTQLLVGLKYQYNNNENVFNYIYLSFIPKKFQNQQLEEDRINKNKQIIESYKSDLGEEIYNLIEEDDKEIFYKVQNEKNNIFIENWKQILIRVLRQPKSIEGYFLTSQTRIIKKQRDCFDKENSIFITLLESLMYDKNNLYQQTKKDEIIFRLRNRIDAKIEFRKPSNFVLSFLKNDVEIFAKTYSERDLSERNFLKSYVTNHSNTNSYYIMEPIGFYILTKNYIIDIEFKER